MVETLPRTSDYVRLNGKYLADAEELVRKGDLPQASEKLWGAFAEMVKAVTARRGTPLGTHRSVAEFVSVLHREHPGWRLMDAFKHAESLHVNFYEDHLPADHVRESGKAVRKAVENLRPLLR